MTTAAVIILEMKAPVLHRKHPPHLTARRTEFICSGKKALQGEALLWMRASMSITLPDPRSLFTCSLESCGNLMGSLSQRHDKPYFLCHLKLRRSSVAGKKIKEAEEKNKSSQRGIWIWNKMGLHWQELTGIKGPMASIVRALRGTCHTRGL